MKELRELMKYTKFPNYVQSICRNSKMKKTKSVDCSHYVIRIVIIIIHCLPENWDPCF